MAEKGNRPTTTSVPDARAVAGSTPTLTISGSVKTTAGTQTLSHTRRRPARTSATS